MRKFEENIGIEEGEVTGGWRKLHNVELQNLYFDKYNYNDQVKRMSWTGHAAHMGRRRMRIGFWWEIQKEIDH
jgi:hypothetical protein